MKFVFLTLCLLLLSGCSFRHAEAWPALEVMESAEVPPLRLPAADGTEVYRSGRVTVDSSHKDQGYIMVRDDGSGPACKLRIGYGDTTYTYDLFSGDFEAFPLQCGSGEYTVRVLERVEGSLYSPLCNLPLRVELSDEMLPYLYPSQIVDYGQDSLSVKASYTLSAGLAENRGIADRLYGYVLENISYDYDKAATVQSGYLPDPDETLRSEKGICYDGSALLASMLRSHEIPTKLVVGYVSAVEQPHAWNQVFLGNRWVWYDAVLTGYDEFDYAESRRY